MAQWEAMEFFQRAADSPSHLGILPGTFNPVTTAHLALARAALQTLDEVVLILPRELPHKEFTGASFGERVAMLRAALAEEPHCSIAATGGGLFIEIADECRAMYGRHVRLSFLCGRDAAERVAGWDYGRPEAFAGMLRQFDLLVAARGGEYEPPVEFQAAIRRLPLSREFEHVSASEVRGRIASGQPWEHLVPAPVRDCVRRIYRPLYCP